MLGFVSAYIPWIAISNLELRHSDNALRSELVLPSVSTLRNICQRECTMTVDAIKQQLPSRNKVSFALDRWTSTNKSAIMSVVSYYMDRNSALREVQLTFDEIDSPFISYLETSLTITGRGPTYRSKASQIFEGSSQSFWADWRPFTWNYNR